MSVTSKKMFNAMTASSSGEKSNEQRRRFSIPALQRCLTFLLSSGKGKSNVLVSDNKNLTTVQTE
jgi:hypothetical protein